MANPMPTAIPPALPRALTFTVKCAAPKTRRAKLKIAETTTAVE